MTRQPLRLLRRAEVTAQSDLTKIGKGCALDWGLNYLALSPPDIVVMIDADCRAVMGTIDSLTTVCEQSRRPVQSLYLMNPGLSDRTHCKPPASPFSDVQTVAATPSAPPNKNTFNAARPVRPKRVENIRSRQPIFNRHAKQSRNQHDRHPIRRT
jgi:hypothetical protein